MTRLRLVLGDQLTRNVAALRDCSDGDVVLMAEVAAETTYVRHHKQKIAFVLSAMRHFAEELRAEGISVDYIKLDAKRLRRTRNTGGIMIGTARENPGKGVDSPADIRDSSKNGRLRTVYDGLCSLGVDALVSIATQYGRDPKRRRPLGSFPIHDGSMISHRLEIESSIIEWKSIV